MQEVYERKIRISAIKLPIPKVTQQLVVGNEDVRRAVSSCYCDMSKGCFASYSKEVDGTQLREKRRQEKRWRKQFYFVVENYK
jgi:hypothetical protein